MPRPITARIDLSALRHNHRVLRARVGQAKIWSVLKANAYGHGVLEAAQALASEADGFALLNLEDAVLLRQAGLTQPILLIEGFFDPAELPTFSALSLTPVLHRMDQVAAVVAAGSPLSVYLKLNTGMNRLGLSAQDFPAALAALKAAPTIHTITLMTHFADADGQGVRDPLSRFLTITQGAGLPVSLANSASLLRFPETHGDWVRPGIALYGASPMPGLQSALDLKLKPVMTLGSELIAERVIAAGESVGYGGSFTASVSMRMGIVACGYADGYPRHAGTGTPILVGGVRTRTLGRVSMDMLAVDLTPCPQAGVGTPVVLWGEGLPADEVAEAAGTISYELLTALTPRVPRCFVGD
jgi:alanine racemase